MTVSARVDTLADIHTERAYLGACLLSDSAVDAGRDILQPSDFTSDQHGNIWAAIVRQHQTGRADVITVANELGGNSLAYLQGLIAETPTISNAASYARRIVDLALRRQLLFVSDDIGRLGLGELPTQDAADAIEQARDRLAQIDMPIHRGAPDPDVDSFIAATDTEYDWLIPEFLERKDRILITASEGAGKSVFLAQLAVMAAAGVHPWTLDRVTPCNVLLVDLENPRRLLVRRLNWILGRVDRSRFDPQRLRPHSRTDGINLTDRADRHWLIDRCQANNADLLVIGPTYRMSSGVAERGDVGGEEQARKVTKALDEIRHRCDVALVMETHAPHGHNGGRDLRPFGSSVWLRWPEFGVGLRRDPDNPKRFTVDHWRGPRDVRLWPSAVLRDSGPWPWTPELPPSVKFKRPAPVQESF